MIDLNPQEKKVVEAMKNLGATAEDKMKTADDIARKASIPKTMVSNILVNLGNKKLVKRVVRQKAAGYYLVQ